MSNIVFNIAKGRVIEFYNRVESADPAQAALVLVPIAASPEAEETARDHDTLALLLAGTTNECTDGTWVRKVLKAAELAALPAPVDTPGNNYFEIELPQVEWTSLSGAACARICVCYRPTDASADSAIIPLTWFDVTLTPDGNTVQMTAGAFFRAS